MANWVSQEALGLPADSALLAGIGIILLVSAVAGYVVTQIFRAGLAGLVAHKAVNLAPWWWNAMLRLVSVMTGMAGGFLVQHDELGLGLGLVGGGLCTLIVWLAKARLKKMAQDAGLPPPPDQTIPPSPPPQ